MANSKSKDVVVTGVSTGIGWGTTKVLVSKGFRVFGSVRKQADADRSQKEFGNGFVPLIMDITEAEAVHQAARKVGSISPGTTSSSKCWTRPQDNLFRSDSAAWRSSRR